jgi:hypothetical protein
VHITQALNLAFPLRIGENGEPLVWAYHTPLSQEVFTTSYRVFAATKAALFSKGIAYAADAGPRIATLTLKDAARADASEWGTEDASGAILAEIRRLTTVLAPSNAGFENVMVDVALTRHAITPEEWEEGESALVFFTVGWLMALRSKREKIGSALALVLGGSMTSLPATEYAASFTTSTKAESSEATPSLVPS